MYDERLAEFSRERLDGRPIPDDLRVLLVAQWEGRTDFTHLLDLDFFEAGEVHPLLDTSYLSEKELADPAMQAVNAGAERMAKYVKLVAKGGKGWIGYWLHPDEPADRAWHLIEFTFWGLVGLTLPRGPPPSRLATRTSPTSESRSHNWPPNSPHLACRWAPRTTTPLMTLRTRWTRGNSWRS
jgi:hypothetical protein